MSIVRAGRRKSRLRRVLRRFSLLRLFAALALYGSFLGAGALFFLYTEFARDLPARLDQVLDYRPMRATRVYSLEGELIGEFYLQKRVLRPLHRVPAHVQNAFIAAEDRRFWKHGGFDPIGIARAAWANYRGGVVSQANSQSIRTTARQFQKKAIGLRFRWARMTTCHSSMPCAPSIWCRRDAALSQFWSTTNRRRFSLVRYEKKTFR